VILVNILFIFGISLETIGQRPKTFIIQSPFWEDKIPACYAANPDGWVKRDNYIWKLPSTLGKNIPIGPGEEGASSHFTISPLFLENVFDVYNDLEITHIIIMQDHATKKWLQLRLEKAPLCPHRITAGAVDIYTQRDF
jgi:hypothetical protein